MLASVVRQGQSINVRCYVWNVSHGGGIARPRSEYRVQITGVSSFQNLTDEVTLVLGFWRDASVFVGFDHRHHMAFGFSPSIQIKESALREAYENGLSLYKRGNGEVAVAVRPDFIGTYVEHWADLHNPSLTSEEFDAITAICRGDYDLSSSEESCSLEPRRRVLVATRKAVREISFRARVLCAYNDFCAICGVQLELIEAAHILPVFAEGSTDETANGIALCALHYKALDNCLLDVSDEYKVVLNDGILASLRERRLINGFTNFKKSIRPYIYLPPDIKQRPRVQYLREGRKARGWR